MKLKIGLVLISLLLLAGIAGAVIRGRRALAEKEAYRLATVRHGPLCEGLLRIGTLKPIKEEHIIGKLWGTILEIAPQGKTVTKDEIVLRVDATPHEDNKIAHEAWMAQLRAEFKKQQQEAAKTFNQAKEDVASYDLRVTLEQMRLDELKKGPTPTEVINAQMNLENAKNLMIAAQEELQALEALAAAGYVSKDEMRQKQLALKEQSLAVNDADIAQRKLFVPDPVKIADQELKVRDAVKTRDAAKERVTMMEQNIQRDRDANTRRMTREQKRLNDLIENISKTVYRAPATGIVVHKKPRWYAYAPGRDVGDGWEVMGLPDFTSMKVGLSVDEAHIAHVAVGQAAEITPAGWLGKPFHGKVTKVADKGHDEFETYADDTMQIVGTANRQVFDVEVEIEEQSGAFRPGLRAQVKIIVKTLADGLLVPRMAIVRQNHDAFVRVWSPDGIERRTVKVLAEDELSAAVEGVQENEKVFILDVSGE